MNSLTVLTDTLRAISRQLRDIEYEELTQAEKAILRLIGNAQRDTMLNLGAEL